MTPDERVNEGLDVAEAFIMCVLAHALRAIGRFPGARTFPSHLSRIMQIVGTLSPICL